MTLTIRRSAIKCDILASSFAEKRFEGQEMKEMELRVS
jgi:hypothetical protein